jgi:hypothetical protein
MGLRFFDKISGKESVEKKKYNLESLENMLKTKIDEQRKIIEPKLQEYYKEILQFDGQLKNSLKSLDSAVPKKRMDEQLFFAAHTRRVTFKNKILKVSDAISKPVDINFHSFSEYYNNCVSTFNKANDSALTEFRTIGIVFKDEGNQVLDDMRKLKDLLSDIEIRIERQQKMVEPYEESLENVVELRKLSDKLEGNKKRVQEQREEIENKKNESSKLKGKIQDLMNTEEWKEYQYAIEKKNNLKRHEMEIRTNFNEIISSIERPMKKVKRVMDEGQEKYEYKNILQDYINEPFETFLKDEGDEALNSILEAMKKLLIEKKIDIKENIREKTINKIDEWISNQTFKNLKEEYFSTVESIKEIITEDDIEIHKSDMEKRVNSIESEIKELSNKIEQIEKQTEKEKTNLEEMKKEVEKQLTDLLGSNVELSASIKSS